MQVTDAQLESMKNASFNGVAPVAPDEGGAGGAGGGSGAGGAGEGAGAPPSQTPQFTEEQLKQSKEFFTNVAQQLGYTLGDDASYVQTQEGIVNFTKEYGNFVKDSYVNQLAEIAPDVKQYIDYRLAGGDPTQWQQTQQIPDYSKIEFKNETENEAMMTNMKNMVINEAVIVKGLSEAEASELADFYADRGSLFDKAKAAQENWGKYRAAEVAKLSQIAEAKRTEQAAKLKEIEDAAKETLVTKGELRGVTIPEKDRQAIFDYYMKPVDKDVTGAPLSQFDKEVTSEDFMLLAMLKHYKFNLAALANTSSKSAMFEVFGQRGNSTKGVGSSGQQQNQLASMRNAKF